MTSKLTPTTRTLRKLEADGWMAQEVEQWIPRTRIRRDLFGVGDVIAVHTHAVLLVQATTGDNGAARVAKIKAEPRMHVWLFAPFRRIEVWAWRELKGQGWQPMITEITLADLAPIPGEGS